MKTYLIAFFACGMLFNSYSQTVNIPDAAFKTYLLDHTEINTNFDDEIQVSEALIFTDSILCYGLNIYDLTGIEAFQNITYLSCVNNHLTALDVSQNTALQGLICAMNQITSLDVSANTNLRNLRCSINPIQNLNVSNNPNLEYLYCESNDLTSLDVSQNPGLLELYCTYNAISTLDLSGQAQLIRLDCSSNPITQLDLATNNALEYIMCNGNQLSSLALGECPSLEEFRGVSNNFTHLDLSNCPNLKRFDCAFSDLVSLDFSHNPLLEVMYCFSSNLSQLNLNNGNNENIQLVWVTTNQLSCIQVDDAAYSTANWTTGNFGFDAGTYFSEQCSAGIEDANVLSVQLYPNPTETTVTVSISEETTYEIISTNGRVVQSGKLEKGDQMVNLESLSAGVYFIAFATNSSGRAVHKVEKI